MKFLLLTIMILAGFGFVDVLATETLEGNLFVMVQTSLRNSDGTLITYLESTRFTDLNKSALNSFLDFEASRGTDPIVLIDGQKYQVIRRVQEIRIESNTVVASTSLFDDQDSNLTLLARFAHDGYPAVSGDKIESIWTFVRPVS